MRKNNGRVVDADVLLNRMPSMPAAELQGHNACLNALAWAPHSSCHICTAGISFLFCRTNSLYSLVVSLSITFDDFGCYL
jgi:hypothetical protein